MINRLAIVMWFASIPNIQISSRTHTELVHMVHCERLWRSQVHESTITYSSRPVDIPEHLFICFRDTALTRNEIWLNSLWSCKFYHLLADTQCVQVHISLLFSPIKTPAPNVGQMSFYHHWKSEKAWGAHNLPSYVCPPETAKLTGCL